MNTNQGKNLSNNQNESLGKKINIKLITVSALLVAVEIVLSRFCSINTNGWKIGFSFVPVVAAAVLYGPAVSAIVYALADFLGAVLFPIGPYFPGFTMSAALMGISYGIFLQKREGKDVKLEGVRYFLTNILPPVLINNLVIGLFINTIWVSVLYGSKTYWGWFLYRLPEYALLIPVNLILIPIIIRLCEKIRKI